MSTPPTKDIFLEAMRSIASTVCVLACCDEEGQYHGMTATSVTSLSLDPMSVLACVDNSSQFHKQISHARLFSVNVLSATQAEQCSIFGSSKHRDKRFVEGWLSDPSTGVPVLKDAQAHFICAHDGVTHYGTHDIIIGRVQTVDCAHVAAPLVWFNRGFLPTSPDQIAAVHDRSVV